MSFRTYSYYLALAALIGLLLGHFEVGFLIALTVLLALIVLFLAHEDALYKKKP